MTSEAYSTSIAAAIPSTADLLAEVPRAGWISLEMSVIASTRICIANTTLLCASLTWSGTLRLWAERSWPSAVLSVVLMLLVTLVALEELGLLERIANSLLPVEFDWVISDETLLV